MDAKEAMLSAMKEWMLPELNSIREDYKNIKTTLDMTNKRLDEMKAHLVDQGRRIDDTRAELKAEIQKNTERIDETRAELKTEIQKNTERIDETNRRIDETRAELTTRIDETRAELKTEIQKNTERIDHINTRIDNLTREVAEVRGDLNKALSDKVVVQDLVERVGRLETRAA